MTDNQKSSRQLKFKLNKACITSSADTEPGHSSGFPLLAFVNVDNPEQVKSRGTQRKIRRHVMTTIGKQRRKEAAGPLLKRQQDPSASSGAVAPIPRPITPPAPSYWGEVRLCPNFQQLFLAMNMVRRALLSITLDPMWTRHEQSLSSNLLKFECGMKHDRAKTRYELAQYTESLGLVRTSISEIPSPASPDAIIGTVICLAYFDVRDLVRSPLSYVLQLA
jgi:hypothetical protein